MLKMTSYILADPELLPSSCEEGENPWADEHRYVFSAPGLSAYEVSSLSMPPIGNMDGQMIRPQLAPDGDKVIMSLGGLPGFLIMNNPSARHSCEVKYFGVRDYRSFFNAIEDRDLSEKAAFFLEEADRSFEAGAYFSFLLMAGAVLEALLQWRLSSSGKDTLKPLINQIEKKGLFPAVEPYFDSKEQMLQEWRAIADARNMLHPSRLGVDSIREKAMTSRAILDKTLKSVW